MHATPMSLQPPRLSHFFTHWISAFAVAVLLAFMAVVAHAAPPPAGTSISNQASASYTDGSNVPRSVTSNVVQTTVAQIASVTLASPGAQNGTPGSVVYYPHTLTNTGNGSDTFVLAATSGATAFTMTNVQIFADNGSGQPTGPAITSTGVLAAGSTFKFIVSGTVPTTATAGQTNVVTVTGTSGFDATKKDTNLDTTTVTSNAVVTLTKAASVSNAAIGGSVTYTLTYTNTGNSTATAVALTDALPAGLSYTANSARWSVTGATALTELGAANGTAPNTITLTTTGTTNKTLLFTLAQVTAGQSGTITFAATVAAATAPGVLNNTATSSYNNGSTTVTGSSNTVPVTVLQTAGVTMSAPPAVTTATAGSTVSFTNVVNNTGNGVDTFNIVITTNNYPTGTTFQLFKTDGLTPLVDTNGDGVVDTGPVAVGASYNVILKATLPPNAPTAAPAGGYLVTKTATSVVDPTKTASAVDRLNAVTGASVDLTNNAAAGAGGALGAGPGPEGSAVLTQTANPGATSTFILVAKNLGLSPDNYNLAVSQLSTFGNATLPTGWTVTFKADGGANNCSTTGATITNTGSVPGNNGSVVVCAVVSVPAGSPAGPTNLYFRTLSPTTGSSDAIYDVLTVNAVRSITITPNGTGQTYPGGSYVYSHTVTNTGNVIEGDGAVSTVALGAVNNQSGWTSTLYYDLNNDSQLDAADPLITANLVSLAPGQSIRVFNKVISPSGASLGAVNATTITVTTTNGSYTTTVPAPSVATDSTTVIAGNLTLVKNQALDTACAGPVVGTVYAAASLSAKPGECVLYRIVVTNVGSVNATSVVVTDSVPSYTTLSSAATTTVGTIATGGPAVGGTGTISANVGILAAGAAATVVFGVKVAN